MSSKLKMFVPDAMLNAFKSGCGHQSFGDFSEECRSGLEAVLYWLRTTLELRKVPNNTTWQAGYNAALEDVIGMFKPNPVVNQAKLTVMGSTLTRTEANEIIDFVNLCVPPEKEHE